MEKEVRPYIQEVSVQDPTNAMVDLYFCTSINAITLAAAVAIGDRQLTLVAGHGVVVGNGICIKQNKRFYQGIVTAVATNLITLDSLLDYAFTVGASAERRLSQMNVNGTTTAAVYSLSPPAGTAWDVCSLSFAILDATEMDDSKFGAVPALTRGIQLRRVNGQTQNLFNIKTNGGFEVFGFETRYASKAPAGSYGFAGHTHFNGPEYNGAVVRLEEGDELQLIIQDDLTGLVSFLAMIHGHVVN